MPVLVASPANLPTVPTRPSAKDATTARPATTSPPSVARVPPHAGRRLPPGALETFTRNLEIQLDAGVPLVRALQVQCEHAETPALAGLSASLLQQLNAGVSLSDAVDLYPHTFHSVYRSLVRAGEHAGRLPLLLRELGEFLAWREDVRKTVRRAAAYPALVAAATFGLLLLIVGYVLPKFAPLFARLGEDAPFAARALLAAGNFVSAHMVEIVGAAIAVPVLLALLARSAAARQRMFQAATALPLFGRVLRAIDLARLTRTLAILTQAGIPLIRALELSRDAVADGGLARRLVELRVAVLGGQTLSQAMTAAAVFPPIALNLVTIGEESGQMPAVLDRLARGFDRAAREAVQKALAMLEPAFTLCLGVMVGGLAIAVISTLYQTMMAVGR